MNTFRTLPTSIKIIFIALVVLIIGSTITIYKLYKELYTLKHPEVVSEAELKKILTEVGNLIVLPQDEMPTLATVSDPEKLKDQPFFANALAGDKVLIYPTSRKAVLWRPGTRKIVEVSALNVGGQGQTVPLK